MGQYILRRLALMVPTLLGILLINFAVVQFTPGGPVEQMLYRLKNNDHSNLSAQAEVQQSGAARGIPPEVIKNRSPVRF